MASPGGAAGVVIAPSRRAWLLTTRKRNTAAFSTRGGLKPPAGRAAGGPAAGCSLINRCARAATCGQACIGPPSSAELLISSRVRWNFGSLLRSRRSIAFLVISLFPSPLEPVWKTQVLPTLSSSICKQAPTKPSCTLQQGQLAGDQCTFSVPLALVRNHQGPAAPRTNTRGSLRRGAAATPEVVGLAALPEGVRYGPSSSLELRSYAVTLVAPSTLTPAPQVLANVVAKLPPCEAIQLQRVSR